jgi:hypothetical protein
MLRTSVTLTLCSLLFACASTIPVKGTRSEVMSIAGEWNGSFQEAGSERHGDVNFALDAGRHSGEGKVVAYADASKKQSQVLKIKFVKIAGEAITGTIAPYADPRCNCTVKTSFDGVVNGDSIIGSYVMSSDDADVERRGEWSAERQN